MSQKESKNPSLPAGLNDGLAVLSRRSVLKSALVFGTSTAALVLEPRLAMAAGSSLPEGIKHMSELEYRVLDRLRVVLLPTQKFNLPSTTVVPVMQNLDDMLGSLGSFPRQLLSIGIRSFEYGSIYRFSRFSQLSDEKAYNHIEAWQSGIFFQRGLMSNLKTLVTFAYWRDDRTWSALEYDGPVTEKWGIRRLGNVPMPRDA